MAKKQNGPNWWQLMLINAGLSAGIVYGTTGNWQAAIGAAVVAAGGGRVANNYNPDGTQATAPYKKCQEPPTFGD